MLSVDYVGGLLDELLMKSTNKLVQLQSAGLL